MAWRQFGWVYGADRKLVPVPDQQKALKRIRKLAGDGLSAHKISADLAQRGVKLSRHHPQDPRRPSGAVRLTVPGTKNRLERRGRIA